MVKSFGLWSGQGHSQKELPLRNGKQNFAKKTQFCKFIVWSIFLLLMNVMLIPHESYGETLYIKKKATEIRIDHNNNSPVILLLKQGDEVDIKNVRGCWFMVSLKKKEITGWVYATEVTYKGPQEKSKDIEKKKKEVDNLFAKLEDGGLDISIEEPLTGHSIRAGKKLILKKPENDKLKLKKTILECDKIKRKEGNR